MAERVGRQVGHYQLLRLVGRGGFAEVYLGEHIHLGTQAAIKLLNGALATADEVERFRQEARTVAALIHPHIVRVLEFGVEEGLPYLVMDYAPGGTLQQQHPPGVALPLATILPWVQQIAQGLQYAHQHQVIHRDIKPQNLLIGRAGEILLSDFGISVMAENTSRQHTQGFAGTAAYAAPEQIQGHTYPASDQYSLGVIVYEWLTGAVPFIGSLLQVMWKQAHSAPSSLREKVPTIPLAVEQVVLTALAKDHLERFGSVQAFATALEQASLLDQQTRKIHPSAPLAPLLPPPMAGIPTITAPLATAQTPTNVAPTVPAQGPLVIAPAVRTPGGVVSPGFPNPAPAQTVAMATGQVPSGAALPLTVRVPLTAQSPGTLLLSYGGHTDEIRAVAWSPDGQRIASAGLDKTVRVWDAATGRTPLIYRGHTAEVKAVAWSPDGQRIASGSADTLVQVWDATTGGATLFQRSQARLVWAVCWSPDGTCIASGGGEKSVVEVWDATSGYHYFTYRGHTSSVRAMSWSPDGTSIASGGADERVRVWGAARGAEMMVYNGHRHAIKNGYITALAWAPDGTRRIASASFDKTVQVWQGEMRTPPLIYRGHSQTVTALTWSPDGTRVASASRDGTVQIWDAATGNTLFTYRGHTDGWALVVAWSPDGSSIASVGENRLVQVWSAEA